MSKNELSLQKKLQNLRVLEALPRTPNGFWWLGALFPYQKSTALPLQMSGFAPG